MILDREQRASDLATKADRDISPKLTDEQYHALLHYTFKAGFKHPVQLLEAFVGDLSGWHRNGSDEEELAGEWFSRAYSGMGGSDSFLYYLYDHETDINELEHIAVTFDHDPEEVYDEDPEEDYRETYGDIYPYDWYEDYLMDVHDEIDADPRETCVKLIRYLLENQVDGWTYRFSIATTDSGRKRGQGCMKFQMPVQHIPRVRIIKSPRFNYSEIEAGVNKLSGYAASVLPVSILQS